MLPANPKSRRAKARFKLPNTYKINPNHPLLHKLEILAYLSPHKKVKKKIEIGAKQGRCSR
jgi:hypothetical protein